MEAVGRLAAAAKVPVLPSAVSSGSSAASTRSSPNGLCGIVSGSSKRRSSFTLFSRGRLSRSQRTDAFSCSVPTVTGSSVADLQEEEYCQASPTSVHGASQGSDFHLQAETCSGLSLSGNGRTWISNGAVLVTSLAVQGVVVMHALASESENSLVNSETLETAATAASRAPEWLAPAIFAFPLVSYFLFGVYRDQVNPDAKVTDWLFGLVALGIVGNIVMQVTWGVRLY